MVLLLPDPGARGVIEGNTAIARHGWLFLQARALHGLVSGCMATANAYVAEIVLGATRRPSHL